MLPFTGHEWGYQVEISIRLCLPLAFVYLTLARQIYSWLMFLKEVFLHPFRFPHQGYLFTVGPVYNHYRDLSVMREGCVCWEICSVRLMSLWFSEASREELSSFWAVCLLCFAVFTQTRDNESAQELHRRESFECANTQPGMQCQFGQLIKIQFRETGEEDKGCGFLHSYIQPLVHQ